MNKPITFTTAILICFAMGFLPKTILGQSGDPTDPIGDPTGPIDEPFWEGGGNSGGVGGFGSNVPEACEELNIVRNKISSDGLLGTIINVGELSFGEWADEFAPYGGYGPAGPGGQGGPGPGLPPPPPPPGGGGGPGGPGGGGYGGGLEGAIINGLGQVFKGIFNGNKNQGATKRAIEELTKVEMTNLVEAECHSILQDLYLTMLEKSQMEKLNDSEYRNSDIEGAIEKVRNARDNIGYLREYIADEYRLLYDIRGRHQEYEASPGYWREVKNDFADYSIEEADELIISARENQLMTGQTKEYIDVLTGMLGKDDLTPGQTQQLEGYISAVHASEMNEMKNILAGQARFIAQMEVQRQQEEKDQAWFRLKRREDNAIALELLKNDAKSSESRSLVPAWAGDKQ